MGKRSSLLLTVVFTGFIFAFFALNLILSDRDFSEQENRYLQGLPDFSLSSLFEGKFTSDFERYVTDQFAFRDSWTALKARSELAVGKDENNGVYFCEGGSLIERFGASDSASLDNNIEALNTLAANLEAPVYFALIPGPSEILKSSLPANAPNDSQLEIIDYAYSKSSAVNVDIYSALSAHDDEYIYYRTDHHWTTLGAYYGCAALLEAFKMPCPPLSSYTRETVTEEFYGSTYSASGFSWVKPDTVETFVGAKDELEIVNYSSGAPKAGVLYDFSFLDKKDKYSMFFGGNTPLLQISTGNKNAPTLLIIRDSYMDCLTPFLLDSFSEIHVLDLRYYNISLSAYAEENRLDNVLVCYSVTNFCEDASIYKLAN